MKLLTYSVKRFSIIASVIIFFSMNVSAQNNGNIIGKIVDSETGEELIGANILLEGTTIGAASDIEGNFKITNVPPSNYSLIASMIGYSKLTITGIELKPGEQKKLDIVLVSEAFETDEVVITARLILDNDEKICFKQYYEISLYFLYWMGALLFSGVQYSFQKLRY